MQVEINWTVLSGIVGILALLIAFIQLKRTPRLTNDQKKQNKGYSGNKNSHRQGILPPNSRYEIVVETVDSIPFAKQTFLREYDSQGHSYPLNLEGQQVRVEIGFTCQIQNVQKALYAGNEYSLNFLPDDFLIMARSILERFPMKVLQEKRAEISDEIVTSLSDHFKEFGFNLLSVTIGAINKI